MIAQFSVLLVCGMSLMWASMPRRQVTSGFFRIQMLIVLGLSVLAILTSGRLINATNGNGSERMLMVARTSLAATAVLAYIGSILWTLDRRPAGTNCVFAILIGSLISLIVLPGVRSEFLTPSHLFLILSNLATAAVLGGAVTGMLLGHWYLTAPTMSIDPLKSLSWFFGAAVILRMIVSIVGWSLGSNQLHDSTHWTWFAMRWLAGILGPLAIAIMAVRILRYRNTQAATGVLFAGVILTFIGEMSAALLYSELHIPL